MKFLLSKLVNVSHSEAGIRCANLFRCSSRKEPEREREKSETKKNEESKKKRTTQPYDDM